MENEQSLMRKFFDDPSKIWREGALKMSFCYLLIDPRKLEPSVTEMVEGSLGEKSYIVWKNENWSNFLFWGLEERDQFRRFLQSIFYVGKGKKSRPLQHMTEAARFSGCSVQDEAKVI